MLMYSTAVLFLALQNSSGFRIWSSDVTICEGNHHTLRRTFLEEHNERRASLAEGKESLPAAANMRFMAYDCELEKEAIKLTARCERFSDRSQYNGTITNFDSIDSNKDNGVISVARQAASNWWKTKPKTEVDKVPEFAEDDDSTIPFFLMAKAKTDKVGCSVRLCDNAYYTVACVYGKKVRAGSKLYKKGPACSKCDDSDTCYQNLCRKE